MSQSSAVVKGGPGAASAAVLGDSERRELERLRQEVARLRAAPQPGRRRIRWASLAAGVLRAVLGVGLVGRALLVSGVPAPGAAAAAQTYDVLMRFLRDALRTLAVLGLVIALGAYLTGPAAGAVASRAALGRGITSLRRGRIADALGSGPVGPFVHAHLRLLQMAVLGLTVLVFVLLDRPTGLDVLLLAFALVVALGVVKFLDQVPEQASPGEVLLAEP